MSASKPESLKNLAEETLAVHADRHLQVGAAVAPPIYQTATFRGFGPTGNVAMTWPVRGSMRDTVPSSWFTTQIDPAPTATAIGPWPTRILRAILLLSGSISRTVFSMVSVTQTP